MREQETDAEKFKSKLFDVQEDRKKLIKQNKELKSELEKKMQMIQDINQSSGQFHSNRGVPSAPINRMITGKVNLNSGFFSSKILK